MVLAERAAQARSGGRRMSRVIVGIDPGVSTGFAVWNPHGRSYTEVTSLSAAEAMLRLQMMRANDAIKLVVFEDARLRTWFGTKGREALQGAGSIKRDCAILADWLGLIDLPFKAVSPKAKGAKVDAARFAKLTGWTGRTNEHARDAAMLVWGMS